MTTRTTARALALLAGAMFVAACGGNAASTGPTQAPVTTAAPAATNDGAASFVLPSLHANTDLEKLIPNMIGGVPIVAQSMAGQDFVSLGSDNTMAGVLTALGKQPSDLSVAFGNNVNVIIIAFQVKGVPADQTLTALINATKQADASTITDASYGGKPVKKSAPADTTVDPSYVYTKDDVVYAVSGTNITDAILNEVFSKLP